MPGADFAVDGPDCRGQEPRRMRPRAVSRRRRMELTEFLTPALIIALFAWLKLDINALGKRIDETNRRFDSLSAETNRRFDEVKRDNADLRERMAGLEGALKGFLAGRRERDAA